MATKTADQTETYKSGDWALRDKQIFRKDKLAATIESDGTVKPSNPYYFRCLDEIDRFLSECAKRKSAGFYEPDQETLVPTPAKPKSKLDELTGLLDAFVQAFEKSSAVARQICLNKHATFFEENKDAICQFYEDYKPSQAREDKTPKAPKNDLPPKHPEEPKQSAQFGDCTPAVVDWRKENWPEEIFLRVYKNRMGFIEQIRSTMAIKSSVILIEEAFARHQISNTTGMSPEVEAAFKIVLRDAEKGGIGERFPGMEEKLSILKSLAVN